MIDFVEWDGTEGCLYDLLIWWASCIPWTHAPDCEGVSLHCCESIYEFDSLNGIEASTFGSTDEPSTYIGNITFIHWDQTKEEVEPGDRIYYRGEGRFELVKHD